MKYIGPEPLWPSLLAQNSLQVCDETLWGGGGNHRLRLFSVIDLVWADYQGIVWKTWN